MEYDVSFVKVRLNMRNTSIEMNITPASMILALFQFYEFHDGHSAYDIPEI